MTRYWDALATVDDWLTRSNGCAIPVGVHHFAFRRRAAVSEEAMDDFERRTGVSIPVAYRRFLTHVGACSLFEGEAVPAVTFLAPWEILPYVGAVQAHTGVMLFPDILLTIALPRVGAHAGFDLARAGGFAVYPSTLPAARWREDVVPGDFEEWLAVLVGSGGRNLRGGEAG